MMMMIMITRIAYVIYVFLKFEKKVAVYVFFKLHDKIS